MAGPRGLAGLGLGFSCMRWASGVLVCVWLECGEGAKMWGRARCGDVAGFCLCVYPASHESSRLRCALDDY